MSKSLKLENDTYIDSGSIVHNKEILSKLLGNLIKVKEFKIIFDVSNASVGDYVIGYTENNIPSIDGMSAVGYLVKTLGYADKNFVFNPHWRNGKIYAKMLIGYKESADKTLSLHGYVIYINDSLIDTDKIL